VRDSAKPEQVIMNYTKLLQYLDDSYIKKICGDIALKVVINGCYYGYVVDTSKGF
jgi:hypothetical protein